MKYKITDRINNIKVNNKKEIILRITKFCNQKCFFCFAEIDNKSYISYNDIINEIDNIINNNLSNNIEFIISGGEPTTHPNFLEIINYIISKKQEVIIQTNAIFFANKTNVLKLKKISDNISFFISFHSNIEEIYNHITGSKNLYISAIKGINNLKNNFNNITLNIVINRLNLRFLDSYFEFIGKYFSDKNNIYLNISIMSNLYNNSFDKTLIKYTDLVNKINSSENIIKKYSIKIKTSFGGPCDLPFCLGKKLFLYNEKTMNSFIIDNNIYNDRIKIDECINCDLKNNCSGILKIYIDKFGKNEFIGNKI